MLHTICLTTALVLGIAALRAVQPTSGTARGYVGILGLLSAILAWGWYERSAAIVAAAVAFTVGIVLFPRGLEWLERRAFGRGRWSAGMRYARLRAVFMPGAGLEGRNELLEGFAILEREGVDRALDYLRTMLQTREDAVEIAVLREQVVAALLRGRRWSEAVEASARYFHPAYLVVRSGLALGLLRGLGELRRIDEAVEILELLERTPFGAHFAHTIAQARLIVLAYGGAADIVEDVLLRDPNARARLDLSEPKRQCLSACAMAFAGRTERARELLAQAQATVHRGSPERAWIDALEDRLLDEAPTGAALERSLVEGISDRLLAGIEQLRRPAQRFSAPLVVGGVVGGHLMALALSRGGYGMVSIGAQVPGLADGYRAFTGVWAGAPAMTVVVAGLAIWVACRRLESIVGAWATLTIALFSAVGSLAYWAWRSDALMIVGGPGLLAVAMVVAALWTWTPWVTTMQPRARRLLATPYVVLLVAAVAVTAFGHDAAVSRISIALAMCVGVTLAVLATVHRRRRTWRALALGGVAAHVIAFIQLGRSGAEVDARLASSGDRVFSAPSPQARRRMRSMSSVPWFGGPIDPIALEGGMVVQRLDQVEDTPDEWPSLMRSHDALAIEPPEALVAARCDGVRAWNLRRDGHSEGLALLRERAGVVIAPSAGLDHAPEVYLTALGCTKVRQ